MRQIMVVILRLVAGVLMLSFVLQSSAVSDSDIDLHWLWRDRCISCHGSPAEFAREFLTVSGSNLHGRHHVDDLRLFLHNHYLPAEVVDDVYTMLLAQASSLPRFKNECSGCHQEAAVFVRENLLFQDGMLTTRKTGMRVKEFMGNHRRLEDEDIRFFTELLTRVAKEVKLHKN